MDDPSDSTSVLDAAVLGAGVSGLAAAHRLEREGLRVVVLEAAERVGGVIRTLQRDGWTFEQGPNTVLTSPLLEGLLRAAGLERERIDALPAARRRYIWKGGRLVPLPRGPAGLLTTPLLPPGAKLRLLREPWARPREEDEETVAAFTRRRLGTAVLDYAVGPFVSGTFAGDPERLSVDWAMPRLASLERRHGSLLRALLRGRGDSAGGPARRLVWLARGLESLPHALAARLRDLRTNTPCLSVERRGEGFLLRMPGDALWARRVVVCVPAKATAGLLDGLTGGESRALARLPYAPLAVVHRGYRRTDVPHPLDGFGLLVPRGESLRILGCLFNSSTFPGRAPEGNVALTVFAGGRTDPGVVAMDDEELGRVVASDLRRALGISAPPTFSSTSRWPSAIPQYELGHARFVELAERLEGKHPGLYIGGNLLRGVSLADCVEQSEGIADRLLASLTPAAQSGGSLRYPSHADTGSDG